MTEMNKTTEMKTTETTETVETKQNHQNKENPLQLLRANRKQANLSDIQAIANQSAIQPNQSVPCTQVIISLNSTLVSLNIPRVLVHATSNM